MKGESFAPDGELPENSARRVLKRAIEIDSRWGTQTAVTQLREAAEQAGISTAAFDAALAEERGRKHVLDFAPSGVWTFVTRNVVSFAAFWALTSFVSRVNWSLGLGWQASHALLLGANLVGVGIAVRLRGRLTAAVLAVTAAAQLAEYPIHLLYGIGAVQGSPTKWALMLAGLGGLGFGLLLANKHKSTPSGSARTTAANQSEMDCNTDGTAAPRAKDKRSFWHFAPVS